jgi:hypothetical protein
MSAAFPIRNPATANRLYHRNFVNRDTGLPAGQVCGLVPDGSPNSTKGILARSKEMVPPLTVSEEGHYAVLMGRGRQREIAK